MRDGWAVLFVVVVFVVFVLLFFVVVFFFVLFFFFVCFILSSRLSCLPFLMPHLLGDGWSF